MRKQSAEVGQRGLTEWISLLPPVSNLSFIVNCT